MDYEKSIKIPNKESFDVLVIEPNNIKDREWSHVDYLHNLANDSFCHYTKTDPNEYLNKLYEYLKGDTFHEPNIKVELISEEPDYITEIMYIELDHVQDKLPDSELNEFATLLNINGDKIYGNAVLCRTYISNDNDDMYFDNLTPDKIYTLLHRRANTAIVTYDSDTEEYKEEIIFGPLELFSDNFFNEKKFTIKKLELPFLRHNINIWYSEDKYGNLDVCGDLLPDECRVDKMIMFSMWTDEYRDSFTLNEFNKIKTLSKKLSSYLVPEELNNDDKDAIGRPIIKNKYKILNFVYKTFNLN
jgi:hypothetical protein